jgi:hypothetical protein
MKVDCLILLCRLASRNTNGIPRKQVARKHQVDANHDR